MNLFNLFLDQSLEIEWTMFSNCFMNSKEGLGIRVRPGPSKVEIQ